MRDSLTTVLDLVGMILLVVAVAVAVWPFAPAASLAVAGLALLGVSWLVDRRRPPSNGGGSQ